MSSVAFGRKAGTGMFHRFAKSGVAVCLIACALGPPARAGTKVAVIDGDVEVTGTEGEAWCALLNVNGYECTLFPESGPTGTLDIYAVVVDLSSEWSDSGHILADVMKSGRGVITWGFAPAKLGIDTDLIVQAWIGANMFNNGNQSVRTTAIDSILGSLVPGTQLSHTGDFGAWAIDDTSGHDDAKVLARHNAGTSTIALLRNRWTGQSVYFSNALYAGATVHDEIILRAVGELSVRTIPATTTWGLIVFGMFMLVVGSILLRRGFSGPSRIPDVHGRIRVSQMHCTLVGFFMAICGSTAHAEITVSVVEGQNTFRVDNNPPFYTTSRPVQSARSITVPDSTTLIFLWEESRDQLQPVSMYAVFLDGSTPARITDTNYMLQLHHGAYDPSYEDPDLSPTLCSGDDEQLL